MSQESQDAARVDVVELATQINSTAAQIDSAWSEFTKWLNSLPSCFPAEAVANEALVDIDGDSSYLAAKVVRIDNAWTVAFDWLEGPDDKWRAKTRWRSWPIDVRGRALVLIPDLIVGIGKSQETRLVQLQDYLDSYEQRSRETGISITKEGE